MTLTPPIAWTEVDRRIWHEELDDFVPHRIFDIHTHLYSFNHYLDPAKEDTAYGRFLNPDWKQATLELAKACDAVLMPKRDVRRLSFPFPFPYPCDFDGANAFLAEQLQQDTDSAGLMLVHPQMNADEVERSLDRYGFVGFKPYRNYSLSGDIQNCRISEFMPEHLVEIADRRGLIIMMHVSKRDAIADAENLQELADFNTRYPQAKWILAHCARSYSAWALERAATTLRDLKNVWYDVSSVCETDAMAALLNTVGWERVMYGSDDLPIGVLRGKYIAFGFAWGYLSETNHQIGLPHCDPRMTFTRYEQLRAMRRAAQWLGLTRTQIQAMFFDTAAKLVESVQRG